MTDSLTDHDSDGQKPKEPETDKEKQEARGDLDKNGIPMLSTEKEQMRYSRMWFDNGVVSRAGFKSPVQVLCAIQALKALDLVVSVAIRQSGFLNGQFIVYGDVPLAIVRRTKELEWIEEKSLCLEPMYSDEDYEHSAFIMGLDNESLLTFFFGNVEKAQSARIEALRIKCTARDKLIYREQTVENNNLDKPTVAVSVGMKRRGDTKPCVTFFSKERAEKAKLWNKAGAWTTHPHIMLMRKARNVCIQEAFSDVTHCVGTEGDVENVPENVANQKLREKIERLEAERARIIEMPRIAPVVKEKEIRKVVAIEKPEIVSEPESEASAHEELLYGPSADMGYEEAVRLHEEESKNKETQVEMSK